MEVSWAEKMLLYSECHHFPAEVKKHCWKIILKEQVEDTYSFQIVITKFNKKHCPKTETWESGILSLDILKGN